jgi:hypothetical protein
MAVCYFDIKKIYLSTFYFLIAWNDKFDGISVDTERVESRNFKGSV